MTDTLPPLPKPDLGSILVGREEVSLGHSYEALRAYAEEAVRLEREAILKAVDDLEEPAWYGYENPNSFDDGKRAALGVVRSRSNG